MDSHQMYLEKMLAASTSAWISAKVDSITEKVCWGNMQILQEVLKAYKRHMRKAESVT